MKEPFHYKFDLLMNKIPKISSNFNMFTNDFKSFKKTSSDFFIFIKNDFKTTQKIFRSIIAIRKHGDSKYIGWLYKIYNIVGISLG